MTDACPIPTPEAQEEFYELHGAYAQALHVLNQFLSRPENQGKAFRVFSEEMIAYSFTDEVEEYGFVGDADLWSGES